MRKIRIRHISYIYQWIFIIHALMCEKHFFLKQLYGTFHFVLFLAVPVDKGGSVSPKIR